MADFIKKVYVRDENNKIVPRMQNFGDAQGNLAALKEKNAKLEEREKVLREFYESSDDVSKEKLNYELRMNLVGQISTDKDIISCLKAIKKEKEENEDEIKALNDEINAMIREQQSDEQKGKDLIE